VTGAVTAFLAAAVVLTASYGAGFAVTAGGRVGISDELRRHSTVFALGLGLLGLVALLLGQTGTFEEWLFAGVALVFGVPGLLLAGRLVRPLAAAWRSSGGERWFLAAAAAVVAFDALLASAPPTSGDAIAYHLVAPKLWFEAGDMFEIWWDWATFQPFLVEMHFAYADALAGGRAAMVVGAGLGAFSAVCTYGLARELAGPVVAAVAALVWVAQGIFLWEATGGFVELALAGFVALAAWQVASLARSRRTVDAGWGGLAVGLAASTKYLGLLFVPVFAVAAVVVTRRGRRLASLAAFGALAAIGLPWYVKNLAVAGDPAYPIFDGLFGGKYWTAAVQEVYEAGWSTFGLEGLWRLPIFPLEFLLHSDRYERGYGFSPALFVLAPVGAVVLRRSWAWVFGAGLVVYAVVWWEALYQITRYLLPVLPFAAVLAAGAAVSLWRPVWPRRFVAAAAAVTVVPFLAMTALFGWSILPGAVGIESETEFVQEETGTYDALRWLDRNLPPEGRVLIGVRNLYWLERPYARFTEPLFAWQHPTEVNVERMREYDVRYLAFLEGELPTPLEPLRPSLRPLATLRVPEVTSRTLGSSVDRRLVVYAWCDAAGDPCERAGEA
jgi:4-amino-4-deoxy-L-arabinose transferase-like glycosyltransferase